MHAESVVRLSSTNEVNETGEESNPDNSNDECIYISDDESDDCIEVNTRAANQNQVSPDLSKTRHYRTYRLVSFCTTRWYSAWLVMTRFYSLRRALRELGNEIRDDNGINQSIRDKFVRSLRNIDDQMLLRVIHFLYPLVQGIDYCQRSDTMQVAIGSMMDSIHDFYQKHTENISNKSTDVILSIESSTIDSIFLPRLSLFPSMPTKLRMILFDELYHESNEMVFPDSAEFATFLQEASDEILDYIKKSKYFSEEWKRDMKDKNADVMAEVKKYINDKKYRHTVHDAMTTGKYLYPILYELYKHFFNTPASSAAVERSFSMQNRLVSPSRNRLTQSGVRDLLFIKMNVLSSRRSKWFDDMLKYLNNSNEQITSN